MSDGERRIARMTGCACLGKSILALLTAILLVWLLLNFRPFMYLDRHRDHLLIKTLDVMKGFRNGLQCFELEYGYLPPSSARGAPDLKTTSRGAILSSLMGQNPLLNPKGIVFSEFPVARNQRDGIWQESQEWVLSDRWGHEYHILLDIDQDGKIANPDTTTAPKNPFLPIDIAIFSAGPDGDPATWEDNIKSW
ncbi:MAG: hypothetical protein IPK32_03630 [Verrucomicrobiaceae bacterium]|nr:hypothetical protein [Verrucomicrobiaceae bacterium]